MNVTLTMKEYEELADYKKRFLKSRVHDYEKALGIVLKNSVHLSSGIQEEFRRYDLKVVYSQGTSDLPYVHVEKLNK